MVKSLTTKRVLSAYVSCYERLGRNLKSPKTVKETNFNTEVVLDYGLDEQRSAFWQGHIYKNSSFITAITRGGGEFLRE